MKKSILTVILLIATALTSSAQLHLTLDEALRIALSENPTIKIADMEVERYDYVRGETWGNLLPQISADGMYTRSIVKQEIAKGLSFGADNTLSATANLALPLFAPQVWRTLRMTKTQLAAAVESARGSRITLTAEVKKAFYNILLAEQSLVVLRESEATVQRTVDDTQVMYDNGLSSEYDLLTAQVRLSNIKPSIIQTENSIKVAKLLLKMYLALPEDVEISVIGSLDEMSDVVEAGGDGLSTDISENSDLRLLETQERLLQNQLKVANASRLPSVAFFASASYSGNDLDRSSFGAFAGGGTTGTTTPSKPSFYWQHPVSAGFQVSVPIFSGLTKMYKSRSIKNQIAQIGLQKEYVRQQIDVQLRSAINELLAARATMLAQRSTVEQAVKAYRIADTRFRAGAGTILELNTAQLSETQARLNYSQAIYDYLSANAEYERILGREQ